MSGIELKNLPQPKRRPIVTSGYSVRGRKLAKRRKRKAQMFGPSGTPRYFRGGQGGKVSRKRFGPKQQKSNRRNKGRQAKVKRGRLLGGAGRSMKPKWLKGSRGIMGRRGGKFNLVKMLVKLIKKAARGKRSSDFRNHGFRKSGRGGKTGFAGMR